MAPTTAKQPHFVFIPLMCSGDMIPMIDMAHLLAERGVISTVITTFHTAARFDPVFHRAARSGLPIRLVKIDFPSQAAGLPEELDNIDNIHSQDSLSKFFAATQLLHPTVENHLQGLQPEPSCIVSDYCLPWTNDTACKLKIPRIVFHGRCSFSLLCSLILHYQKPYERVTSEYEPFVLPSLPQRIEVSKSQLSEELINRGNAVLQELKDRLRESESKSYGVVINSFNELEPEYVEIYKKALGKKVWTIGPVSLRNREMADKAERGNRPAIDANKCLSWLDSKRPGSVLYACFGSIDRITNVQLMEVGLGLEALNRPFVFVVKRDSKIEKLQAEGFEERVKERGLVIHGWAPQTVILSHKAVGGFLTHCGWNSTLESICAGVPILAWPLSAEQFLNEKLIVNVLKVGFSVGIRDYREWTEEQKSKLVRMEEVKEVAEKLMGDGSEIEEMRVRIRKLAKSGKSAMEEGGSSFKNLALLIDDISEKTVKEAGTSIV